MIPGRSWTNSKTYKALQQDVHNPVKMIRRIKEFSSMMRKLELKLEESLETDGILTNYKEIMNQLKNVEEEEEDRVIYSYQGFILSRSEGRFDFSRVKPFYKMCIDDITRCMENRFDDIHNKPVIDHLVKLLDISTWPLSGDQLFGDDAVNGFAEYFHELLVKNGCAIENIPTEWQILKGFMFPIMSNNKKSTYLEVWKNIITNDEI